MIKKKKTMNEKIIFKWVRECDRESIGKYIWKSG